MFTSEKIELAILGLGYVGRPLAVDFGKNDLPMLSISIHAELQSGQGRTLELSFA